MAGAEGGVGAEADVTLAEPPKLPRLVEGDEEEGLLVLGGVEEEKAAALAARGVEGEAGAEFEEV